MPFNPSYRPYQDPQDPQQQQDPLAPSPAAPSPAQAYNPSLGADENYFNSLFSPGQISANDLQAHAGDLAAHGLTYSGGDTLRDSQGRTIDVLGNYNAGTGMGENQWLVQGANGGGAGGGGGAPAGSGGGSLSATSQTGTGMNVDPQLRDALLALMARSAPGPIDINSDPNLAPQANAYSAARQQGAARERAALAERAAFGGLNSGGAGSGAFNAGVADVGERAAQDIAGQQAGLVGQEVTARRNDLMNSLQLANAIGARDQSASIQAQLANLDNQYKYAALGQNQSQFNDQYGLNKAQLGAQLNRDAYLQLLGGGGQG